MNKGQNVYEEILSQLIRFQLNEISDVSDIEKAFLQIKLNNVKFLWIDKHHNLKIFLHARVADWIASCRFLIIAEIDYHLRKVNELRILKLYGILKKTLFMIRFLILIKPVST